jgi:hypothetical protein
MWHRATRQKLTLDSMALLVKYRILYIFRHRLFVPDMYIFGNRLMPMPFSYPQDWHLEFEQMVSVSDIFLFQLCGAITRNIQLEYGTPSSQFGSHFVTWDSCPFSTFFEHHKHR